MDYFTLNRRELQALCKKHGIPANLTNVSMAEALTALLNVDDNKPSDDRYQKQQVASEDTGDKSVLTDISDNPRRCTKSKKQEVAAEGKSAEEPIVLDDDEALSPLKEIHIKSATKTLKGKGGDRTEKSRSTIRQRKILDKDDDEASDAVTPYISVKARRGRTCKKGTNAKNPKTRTCYATDTDDAKPLQQKYNSCENDEESYGANNGSSETRPKKVDKVEMATEESIIVSTHTKDAKSQQQEHDSCEKRKENEEPKNGSVEEAPKARPKRGLSRKQVDKSEQTTEERIQVAIDTEDAKPLKQEDNLSEKGKGSDEANNGSVKAVPKARPKGRLSRKKVEEMEMATEGSSNQISTNEEDDKPLQKEHESCEQGEGSDEANNGSVGVAKTRANSRLLRKKVDKVEMVTEEGIQESVDANDHSVEVILRTRSKARPSRNRVDKLEEAAEEIIQGTNNAKDGSVNEVHENRHKSIRNKFDAVREAEEEDNTIGANHSVEEGSGTSDANDESVEIAEATAESVKEVPENMPKGKLSSQKIEEATEENIKWTDDVKDEEISRTKGRSSSRKRSEEAAVDDEIKDRNPICRRSTRANALKVLDTQPLIIRSLPRRKYNGEDFVKGTPRASKRTKNSSDKIVKYDPAEASVKVSAKKRANEESPKFLDGDSMEGSARKIPESKTPGIKDEESLHEGVSIAKCSNGTILETMCAAQEGEAPGIKDEVNHGESARKINKEVSIFTQANQIQKSHDSADVKNVGEAEGNTGAFEGESMHEGVSIAESPNGAELETLCSQEGRAPPSFKDMDGHADSIKEGMDISERFNVTESKTPGIKDEESLHEGVSIAKCSNGTILETMCAAQEGEAPGIKDEVDHGESIPEAVSQAESPTRAKTETMCAQEGKAPGIKDEVSQGNSIQEGVSRAATMCDREAESPNETEPETMCAQEGTTSSIKEEENQGESVQDSRNTAKSPNGTEPEIVCGQESEFLGIEDDENQGKAIQKTVSIAVYETEPKTMCVHEGKAPGINDEESQGESIQEGRSTAESPDRTESEIMCGQESESPRIKVEESQGKTSHKTVSLSDSNNETEPEDKAPGIKDEESQGESMQEDSMSIAESPNGTETEIVCGKESKGQNLKPESIADGNKKTEAENMQSPCSEASGGKDETNLLNPIERGIISIPEGHDQTELGTMHLDPKVGAKLVFSYSETERKFQFYNDKSYKELSTGLEDEDVFDDIKVHISEDVSEAVTSVSIGNGKADLVEKLPFPSIVDSNQRVTSSVQVDNEPKSQKRLASSSVQIDSEDQMKKFTSDVVYSACMEERIEDSYSHEETGLNKSPLAKELIHYKEKHFVPDAVLDEKLNDFSDESGGKEEFVPWTPPKEEQHFPVPVDDDQEPSHVKLEVLALGNTDEESEEMDSQQAFKTDREVQDLGLGNKNSLALQEYEQQNAKEFEECQDKALLNIDDTHFHEKTCVPDEQVQVSVDKIEKKISPHIASLSVRKLKAMIKDREEEDLCLGKKNLLALQGYEQQNTKAHLFYMEDARFHEKTCDPDEQVQVTYVNKLIQKEISPPLTSLSLRKLKAMYKDTMAKKENCNSIHFQEKSCSKDRLTWGNKLKNENKEENCANLSEPIVRKENKVGKRSALHNLSSNDLEERQKEANKAE